MITTFLLLHHKIEKQTLLVRGLKRGRKGHMKNHYVCMYVCWSAPNNLILRRSARSSLKIHLLNWDCSFSFFFFVGKKCSSLPQSLGRFRIRVYKNEQFKKVHSHLVLGTLVVLSHPNTTT